MKKKKKGNIALKLLKEVVALIAYNKVISLAVLGLIVIIIIVSSIVSAVRKKHAEPQDIVGVETEAIPSDEYVIHNDALEVDAYPEINALMRKYYDAAANGDVATIESIKTPVDDKEKIIIAKKAEYLDSYPVVTCYTKLGPVEGAYLVFAYYEVKLVDYETLAPGLNAWYVCKRPDGSYYINDDEQDEKLANYCKIICVQDDVVDLNNKVNVKFNEVVAQDSELASFLELLPEKLTASVGDELAKANEEEEQATAPVPEAGTETATTVTSNGDKEVRTTDVVNVRSSDSETADRVGKAQKGDTYKLLEQKVNGWSKIMFEGKEAYIKSEYLQIVGEETASTGTTETAKEETISDAEAIANSPSSGVARARDTVNVREKDSTDAGRVAMAYKGEEMTVIEKQSNGWTKVKFNGKTGFVKSEYLEK